MKTAEPKTYQPTPPNTARTALPPKLAKLIFLQRATIILLFASLLVAALYARAAQNRAARWKAEAARLQTQLIQAALTQPGQNETAWIQNAEAQAADATQRPDGIPEPPLHVGMTRADVERVFTHDGGPFAIGEERYILGDAPTVYSVVSAAKLATSQKVVKVTIRYVPSNLAGMVSPSFSEPRPDDIITDISEPYLEEPCMN